MKRTTSSCRKRWFFARSMARAYREWLEKRTQSGTRSGAKPVKAERRPLFAEALEPRVLFSATPVPVEAPGQEDQAGQDITAQTSEALDEGIDAISRISFDEGADTDFSEADLERLANEAVSRWEKSGLTAEQIEALESITYVVSDLEGSEIGAAEGNTIYLDYDAAGADWFIDDTEWLDEEFVEIDGILRAASGDGIDGLAGEGIDMLSILMHEQGHILGLLDDYSSEGRDSAMYGLFDEGERRLLEDRQADGSEPLSLSDEHFAHLAGTLDQVPVTDQASWDAAVLNGLDASKEIVFNGTGPISISTGDVTVGALHFQSGEFTLTGGTITIGTADQSLKVDSGVSATIASTLDGTSGLAKVGTGIAILSGTNTYTGVTTVSEGILELASDDAVNGTSGIQINGASSLQLRNVTVDRPVFANSVGYTGLSNSAVHVVGGGASVISGHITLQRGTSIKVRVNTNTSLEVSGGVSGNHSFALYDDASGAPGIVVTTNPINIGTATFSGHGLTLNVGGNTVGTFRADWGQQVTLGVDNVFTTPPALLLANSSNASGRLDLNGHDLEVVSVTAGQVSADAIVTDSTGTATLTVTTSSPNTFHGVLSGGLQLTKAGSSDLTLTGNNSYTGVTTVTAGTLALSGTGDIDQSSEIAVTSGAIFDVSGRTGGDYAFAGDLTGTGIVNGTLAVGVGGNLQPGGNSGDDVGTLTITGDATITGDFDFDINGGATDQLIVDGAVNSQVVLGGSISFNVTADPTAKLITVIDNDGTADPTTGIFKDNLGADLPEGSTVALGGKTYKIFYNGGDGNDVVLADATAPTTVYVNPAFAAATNGTLVDGDAEEASQQDAVVGISAFATITEAIAALGTNDGTIIVNPGDYSAEAVDLTTAGTDIAVTLRFVGGDSELGSLATGAADRVILGGYDVDHTTGVTVTLGALNDGFKEIEGVVSGTGGFTKVGTGSLKLSGDNTYSGITTVNRGRLYVGHNNALGATGEASKTIVNGADGSTASFLYLDSDTPLTINETLNLHASIDGRVTVYSNSPHIHTLAGPIDVSSSSLLVQFNSNGSGAMRITGDVTGTMTGGAVFMRGSSTNAANHFQGSLNLSGSSLLKTDDGTWTVGAPGSGQTYSWNDIQVARGKVVLGAANILNPAKEIRLDQNDNAGAILDLNNFDQTVAGIRFYNGGDPSAALISTGTGTLTLNGGILYDASANTAGGEISGKLDLGGATRTMTVHDSTGSESELIISAVISNGGIKKAGAGSLVLSGDNTYAGTTSVSAGTLRLSGNHVGGGEYTVENSATLSGTGSTDANVTIDSGGVLSPGIGGIGTLTINDQGTSAATINGQLSFEINGNTSADLLDVNGTVSLGATSVLSVDELAGVTPTSGETITVIDNDLVDAVSGTFNGLLEGATVTDLDSNKYTISYAGGDGNDVVLFAGIAETNVDLTGGILTVSDIGAENADAITISYDSDDEEYVISDPNLILSTTGLTVGQVSRPDAHTVRVKASLVTSIVVNTANPTPTTETDTVTLASLPASIAGNLEIHAETIHLATDVTTTGTQTFDGSVNLDGNVTLSGSEVVFQSREVSPGLITIDAAETLTVTGDLLFGARGVNGLTTNITMTGGGHFVATGTSVEIGGASDNGSIANVTIVDMSGLGSLTSNGTNFRVGYGQQNRATLILSDTANSITGDVLNVSDSRGLNASSSTLILGAGTNTFNVDQLDIGISKGVGTVKFASQAQGSAGALTLRAKDGVGAVDITVGENTNAGTGANISGTLDLRGHSVDVLGDALVMAYRNRPPVSTGGGVAGTVSFDTGTFTVNSVDMANRSGEFQNPATATLNIGGGIFTVNSGGSFSLGTGADSGAARGTVNLTGGQLISHVSITETSTGTGTVTSLIDITGDTTGDGVLILHGNIDVAVPIQIRGRQAVTQDVDHIRNASGDNVISGDITGVTGGGEYNISSEGGTLEITGAVHNPNTGPRILNLGGVSSAEISGDVTGGWSVEKKDTGTWAMSGTNTYSGTTIVMGGALLVNGDNSGVTSSVFVNSGGELGGTGTIGGAVSVSDGGEVQPGDDGVGTLTLLANTTINGGFAFDIDGAGSDTLVVDVDASTVTLNASTSSLSVTDATAPTAGSSILVIDNAGSDDVIGTFAGHAEGAMVTDDDGGKYTISYAGGDGNDVVLFAGAAETDVALSGSVLTISDILTENADAITVSYDSGANEYVISDPNLVLKTTGLTAGQFWRPDAHTVRVDASLVTSIVVNTANPTAGTASDSVTIASLPAGIPGNLEIHAETIQLNTGITTGTGGTTGNITLEGNIVLGADVRIDTTGTAADTFAAVTNGALTITGMITGNNHDLTIRTGSGNGIIAGNATGIDQLQVPESGVIDFQSGFSADDLLIASEGRAATVQVTGGDVSVGSGDSGDALTVAQRRLSLDGNTVGTFDVSGASSFTANVGVFQVARLTNNTGTGTVTGTVTLGSSNSVNATAMTIGHVDGGNTRPVTGHLNLGTSNTFKIDTFVVGSHKSTGNVSFSSAGTLTLDGLSGAKTDLRIGDNSDTSTSTTARGNMDLSGGVFDANLDELVIGDYASDMPGNFSGSGSGIGTLTLSSNALNDVDANSVELGSYNRNGTVGATSLRTSSGTITMGGGTFDVVGDVARGQNLGAVNGTKVESSVYVEGGIFTVGGNLAVDNLLSGRNGKTALVTVLGGSVQVGGGDGTVLSAAINDDAAVATVTTGTIDFSAADTVAIDVETMTIADNFNSSTFGSVGSIQLGDDITILADDIFIGKKGADGTLTVEAGAAVNIGSASDRANLYVGYNGNTPLNTTGLMDLSNAATFDAYLNTFVLGERIIPGLNGTTDGDVLLAAVNNVDSTTVLVSHSAMYREQPQSVLTLGATNTFKVDTFTVGGHRGRGLVEFAAAGGVFTLSGSTGTETDLVIGETIEGTTNSTTGVVDLNGGTFNATLDVLDIAFRNARDNFNPATKGTLSYDSGTVTANSVILGEGQKTLNGDLTTKGEGHGDGVLNVGGDAILESNDIRMAIGSSEDSTGTVNQSDGEVDLLDGTISVGIGTADYNLTGGVLKDVSVLGFDFEQEGGTLQVGGDGEVDTMTIEGDFTASGGAIELEIDGAAGAGVSGGHDQIIVADSDGDGALDLTGSRLELSLDFAATAGQIFVLIDNDTTSDPITGTFAGMPEGHVFSLTFGGQDYMFRIHYNTEDGAAAGNNVVLESFGLAETSVEVVGGQLTITDINNDSQDDITIIDDGTDYIVSDSNLVMVSSTAGVTIVDANTVRIPKTLVTAGLSLVSANGADAVGANDTLTLAGPSNTDVDFDFGGDVTLDVETLNLQANLTGGHALNLTSDGVDVFVNQVPGTTLGTEANPIEIEADITALNAHFRKTSGNGAAFFNGDNSGLSGTTTLHGSNARWALGTDTALGAGGHTVRVGTDSDAGQQWFIASGDRTIASDLILDTQRFIIRGTTIEGSSSGAITINGDVTLSQSGVSDIFLQRNLTINGVISGTTGLEHQGGQILTLTNSANSFTGGIDLDNSSGTLVAANAGALGDAGNIITFTRSATIQLNSDMTVSQSVVINPGLTGTFDTNGNDVTLNNIISGQGGLMKAGAGALSITQANTYQGGTTIGWGTVRVAQNTGFGSGDLIIQDGTAITNTVNSNSPVTLANDVVVNGDFTTGELGFAGPLFFEGNVDLGATDRQITTLNSANNGNFAVKINGVISGDGGLTKAGSGFLNLGGLNTFAGGMTLNEGTLVLTSGNGDGLGSGTFTINGGTVASQGFQQPVVDNEVLVGGDFSILSVNPFTFSNTIDLGGATRAITSLGNGNKIISADISNGGLSLSTAAPSDFIFSGTNTYTGTTDLESGTLIVNGTHTGGDTYTIADGAVLSGTGAIDAAIVASGNVSPGDGGAGDLETGDLNIGAGGSYTVDIDGTTTGDGAGNYDQIVVTGSVNFLQAQPNVILVTDNAVGDQDTIDFLVSQFGAIVTTGSFNALTLADQAMLAAADLVIVSRTTNSGNYDNGGGDLANGEAEVAFWEDLETPTILMSAFLARNSRWDWVDTGGLAQGATAAGAETTLTASGQTDSLFGGLNNPVDIYNGNYDAISNGAVGGGTVLATGNGGAHIVAASWNAGDALGADGRVAGGDRLFLASQSGGNVSALSADGRAILERAIGEFLFPDLEVTVTAGPTPGHTYVIIDNDTAVDAVTGAFRNQEEGSVVTATGGEKFVISYLGGDGNDVVLYGGVETQVEVKGGVLSITDITTDSVNDISVTYNSGTNTYTISEADVANVIATSGATVISRTANSVTIDATGINEIRIDATGPDTSNAGLETGDTVSLNVLQADIDGAVTITAETINLGGDVVADAITLNGDVTLTADVVLDTEDVNGAVVVNGTVDGTFDLTINTGTGTATVTGEVGGTAALDAFSVLKGATTLQAGLTADDLNVATVTNADPVPATATLTVAGGAVSIGNGDGDETIAIGTRDASYAANSSTITGTVDFSAATSVTINVDMVALGTITISSDSEGTAGGHLKLSDAGVNTVTAASIVVGDSPARGNSVESTIEFGGGTNTVNVDTFTVGGRKSNAIVTIDAGGTLSLSGKLPDTATNLNVGRNAANTGNNTVAVLDMTAGTFNATLDVVVLGLHNAGNGSGKGTFSFDTGTVTANSILLADANASGNSNNDFNTTGTINFGGGVLDLQGGNIVEGGGVETFNFIDGTLKDVNIIDFTTEDTTRNREFEQSGGTFQIGADGAIDTTTIKADFTASGGDIEIQIAGTNGAGVAGGHDQIIVNPDASDGALDLTGSSLNLAILGGFTPSPGDTFVIIDNDGSTDTVTGIFTGLPEGSTVTVGGQDFVISYAGGDGNDVVLFAGPAETQVDLSAGGMLEITDIGSDSVNTLTVSYDAVANTYTISELAVGDVIGTSGVTVISRTANSVTISGVGITAIDIDTTDPGTSVVGVDDSVTVTTSGALAIAGGVSITSDDITIGDADISSGADITLNAGDHLILDPNGELAAASGSIEINVDQVGAFDAAGGTVDLLGTVSAGNEVFITGGSEGDTFNVKPSLNTGMNIDGNDPDTVPGDVINLIDAVDADFEPTSPVTDGAGSYTFGGGQQRIDFEAVENDNLAPDIIVTGADSDHANLTETDSPLSVAGTLTVQDLGNVDATINGTVGIAGTPDVLTNADFLAMFSLTTPNPIVTAPGTIGTIGWRFDSNVTTFDFLALGETLTLTYTITATDPATGSDTQTVTIKITGTNDDPVLTSDVVTVFEGGQGGSESVSGNALANDTDSDINGQGKNDVIKVVNVRFDGTPFGGSTHSGGTVVEGSVRKVDGLYGTLSIDADGNFVYTVDSKLPTTRALDTGDVGVETFVYLVSDGSGGFVEETIVVRVVGETGGRIGEFFGIGGSGILEGFRFAGSRDESGGGEGAPVLMLMPTYSGTAAPGSVITLTVMGPDGSMLLGGSMTVVADLSGAWIAKFSGLEIGNTSYFVKVETAAPAWGTGVAGAFKVFFAPAINGSHTEPDVLSVDSVMGRRLSPVALDTLIDGNAHPNGSNADWRRANGVVSVE